MKAKMNLAIIPARSGSKGLKDKNIKPLNGKPLMAYTIEAALESKIFDTVYVSTDSEEYAKIAVQYNAEVPFLRSAANAGDTASSWDVVREALYMYEQAGKTFDMVTLLQPTTPLRDAGDIKRAYDLYSKKKARAVISVCEVDHSPLWCNTLPEDLSLKNFIDKNVLLSPRQKLETYYRINGGIYMADVPYFQKEGEGGLYSDGCYAYIMDKERSIDIDDEFDFFMAEAYMKHYVRSWLI